MFETFNGTILVWYRIKLCELVVRDIDKLHYIYVQGVTVSNYPPTLSDIPKFLQAD